MAKQNRGSSKAVELVTPTQRPTPPPHGLNAAAVEGPPPVQCAGCLPRGGAPPPWRRVSQRPLTESRSLAGRVVQGSRRKRGKDGNFVELMQQSTSFKFGTPSGSAGPVDFSSVRSNHCNILWASVSTKVRVNIFANDQRRGPVACE